MQFATEYTEIGNENRWISKTGTKSPELGFSTPRKTIWTNWVFAADCHEIGQFSHMMFHVISPQNLSQENWTISDYEFNKKSTPNLTNNMIKTILNQLKTHDIQILILFRRSFNSKVFKVVLKWRSLIGFRSQSFGSIGSNYSYLRGGTTSFEQKWVNSASFE